MPKLIDTLLERLAKLIRPLTRLRGTYRIIRLINQLALKFGAEPIRIARLRDGSKMRIDLRSQTEWFTFYSGSYDDASLALIRSILSRFDGDFLDVGGNIGMYAVRIARYIEPGRRCICVEPIPANAQRIRENVSLNNLEDQIEVHAIALSDTDGRANLVLREDFALGAETGNASVAISESADRTFKKIGVPMRRFDKLLAEKGWTKIPVVKVDIEGHEDFFLRGAAMWLQRDRPIIITEINNWFYHQRGTSSSAAFSRSLPTSYEAALFRAHGSHASLVRLPIENLDTLESIETCIMYPVEAHEDLIASFEQSKRIKRMKNFRSPRAYSPMVQSIT